MLFPFLRCVCPFVVESSSFAPLLFAHFCSALTLKEPNYRNEITRQFHLTPDYALLNAHHALSNLLILFLD